MDELGVLERHTTFDHDSGYSCAEVAKTFADPTFPGPMVSGDDRSSWGLSQRDHTADAPPIWTPSSPQLPAFPISDLQVDTPVTPEREEVTRNVKRNIFDQLLYVTWLTHSSLDSRDHVSEPPSSRIVDLPLPVFPRITLPRFSLSPSGIHKVLERPSWSASSEPGNDHRSTEVGGAAPDTLLDGLLSSAQNGEFYSTGNCFSRSPLNFLHL